VNTLGGRALEGLGGREPYQTLPNSEYPGVLHGRQSMGDKVHGREGNNPDLQQRSPSDS
jgi:hypothetical protein